METIREMVIDRFDLPNNFNVYDYELFQGMPTKIVSDHDVLDIGGRQIEVLHTPGDIHQGICAFGKKTKDTYLLAIWYIKIYCLHIILLLTLKHILLH